MPNSIGKVQGSGQSGMAATAICGDWTGALTATGSSQATALLLNSNVNEVTTTASSTGVIFPANLVPSDEIVVANYGAQTLSVYPALGEAISNGSTNAAFSVATNKTAYFVKTNATRWSAVLTA